MTTSSLHRLLLILTFACTLSFGAIQQTPLPYPKNALEPYLSAETVEWHYRLHGEYVKHTNEVIKGTVWDDLPLSVIVMTAPYKSELYNHSLQSFNHNFNWQILAPPPIGGGLPKGSLAKAIDLCFGGLDGLKKAFVEEQWKVFASGYVALVKKIHTKHRDHGCDLAVGVTGDADNPLRLGLGVPLVVVVWEHSYWHDVKTDRLAYLENSFHIVNWHVANRIYEGDSSLLFQ